MGPGLWEYPPKVIFPTFPRAWFWGNRGARLPWMSAGFLAILAKAFVVLVFDLSRRDKDSNTKSTKGRRDRRSVPHSANRDARDAALARLAPG